MSQLFKNKYKLIVVLLAFVLAITLGSIKLSQMYLDASSTVDTDELEQPESIEEQPEEPEPEPEEYISFNSPGTMRGVFLTPGEDFMLTEQDTQPEIEEQIMQALISAHELSLNTIIINTNYEDKVIYDTPDSEKLALDFDLMKNLVEQCRSQDFYVYSVFDVSKYKNGSESTLMSVESGSVNSLLSNAGEFAEKYELDGILLDGYQNESDEQSYSIYSKLGGAIGYKNYMRETPRAMLKSTAGGIKQKAPSTQVGLLADSVWANYSEEQTDGSKTASSYTALETANADTRAYIEEELFDFVLVKAEGAIADTERPFSEVVSWWSELLEQRDTPLYIMQFASKVGSQNIGWAGSEELLNQAVQIDEIPGISGNVFDSLTKLKADPGGSTTNLMKYYKEELEPELILAELEMTKPSETVYTTTETHVTFTGASDPNEPVKINGENIQTDQSGYFTATYELSSGLNEFNISHKEKSIDYKITRQVNILTEITPTGTVTADGGMEITITATAYEDASVIASVGGQSITLTPDETVVDESQRDSTYRIYSGTYTTPAATTSAQNLGAISVTANWQGESKTLTGASITVNPKVQIEDGVPVVVTAQQAKTYPANTLNNIPRADCYPLPKGAMDYAVGEEIVYKGVPYTVLASGLRVQSSDISASSDFASGNVISDLSVNSRDGSTFLTLKTAQKVSYNFGYSPDAVTIAFNNTESVPADVSLSQNPLFSAASWSGSTLRLPLLKQGGFMGYKAYYNDGGDLVFEFNNTPASISSARIAIDPGHGGRDTGALGFLADYPEKTLNSLIAQQLADELQSRGAAVLLLDTSGGMDLATRIAKAESFNADLFISVHNNTAPNSAARGTEVYYFYPFSKTLATTTSSNVSAQLNTSNRGAKQSYYTVTLSSEFSSVLVECGFMSNKDEYEKLIREKYQQNISLGIADGISEAISAAYTGVGGSGTEGSGTLEIESQPESSEESQSQSQETGKATLKLSRSSMTLWEGRTSSLKATVSNADVNSIRWSSSNNSVATVDSSGRVSGVKRGETTITATLGDLKAECAVTVVSDTETETDSIAVEEIHLSDSSITVETGQTRRIDAGVYPTDATDKKVSWRSSNTSIATVDADGNVKGVAVGSTIITATSSDGKVSATCSVSVTGKDGTTGDSSALKDALYIELFDVRSTMYVRTSQTLKVRTDKGKTIPNTELVWEVSDRSMASVTSDGVLTVKRNEGTFALSVDTKDGKLFDTMTIEVTRDRVTVDSIKFDVERIVVTQGGKSEPVKVLVTPSNATVSDFNWSTANSSIATVNSNGVVTGHQKGSTTLIVKTADNRHTITCRIEVVESATKAIDYIEIYPDVLEIWVDEEDYLDLIMEPDQVAGVAINWSSSRKNIVSVDSNGNIKGLKPGTATITATLASEPSIKASCTVTVIE